MMSWLRARDVSRPPDRPASTAHGSAIPALSTCVARCIAEGLTCPDVAAQMQRCAREARRDGVKPERLVIAIRTAWYDAAASHDPLLDRGTELLKLTDLVLDAYFDNTADR